MTRTPDVRARGWRRFALGIALYVVLVLLQALWLEPGRLPLVVMVPLALLPMAPALWGMAGALAALRSLDELEQKIHGEAGLVALGGTAATAVSYGFLEVYAGAPPAAAFAVWGLVGLFYALGLGLARRRYR